MAENRDYLDRPPPTPIASPPRNDEDLSHLIQGPVTPFIPDSSRSISPDPEDEVMMPPPRSTVPRQQRPSSPPPPSPAPVSPPRVEPDFGINLLEPVTPLNRLEHYVDAQSQNQLIRLPPLMRPPAVTVHHHPRPFVPRGLTIQNPHRYRYKEFSVLSRSSFLFKCRPSF